MFNNSDYKSVLKITEDKGLLQNAITGSSKDVPPSPEEQNSEKGRAPIANGEPNCKAASTEFKNGEPESRNGEPDPKVAEILSTESNSGEVDTASAALMDGGVFAAVLNEAAALLGADGVTKTEGDSQKKSDGGSEGGGGDAKVAEVAASAKPEESDDRDEDQNKSIYKVPQAKDCQSKEEVTKFVLDRLNAIKEQESYDNEIVLKNLKGLGRVYWDQKSRRSAANSALVKENFGELAVKMMRAFNQTGVFSNDAVWFPCYYIYNNCWNFSDSCKDLCQQFCDVGMISVLLSNITHQPYLDNLSSKNVLYLVKSSLSILNNVARVPETKPVFTEKNAVVAVKPFTESKIIFFKLLSMMLLTNIISEEENATLEDTGAIKYNIMSLESALTSPKRRHRGFDPTELAEGLGRMAVNDSNKMKIIEGGALPQLVKMMQDDRRDEQQSAAQALWTLAFGSGMANRYTGRGTLNLYHGVYDVFTSVNSGKDHRAKEAQKHILNEPDCIAQLERLSSSENAQIRNVAKGALWVLQDKADTHAAQADEVGAKKSQSAGHVFISYNWDHQSTVIMLSDRLKADGYSVWLDVDQMGGSTLEAMATAVEQAAVVLIDLSEKYKLSPNCRTEAEYTFQLHKPIVPLMMQRRYRADGWLGMLVGAKLYINFDGKYSFDDAYQMLLKELCGRGKDGDEDKIDSAVVAAVTGSAPAPSYGRAAEVKAWDREKVAEWLAKNKMNEVCNSLREFDGKLLIRFNKIRHEAPDFFYQTLDKKLGLDTLSLLKFTEALDDLLK